jgi:hypothetical protein
MNSSLPRKNAYLQKKRGGKADALPPPKELRRAAEPPFTRPPQTPLQGLFLA